MEDLGQGLSRPQFPGTSFPRNGVILDGSFGTLNDDDDDDDDDDGDGDGDGYIMCMYI